jgi:hypothetical protein
LHHELIHLRITPAGYGIKLDRFDPLHLEALRMQPDILPGLVVPDALREDALPMAA